MSSNLLQAIHSLKKAQLHLKVFAAGVAVNREKSRRKFNFYADKIEWILTDFKTEPLVPKELSNAIDEECKSDCLTIDSINEKLLLISPGNRDVIDNILDCIIKGEPINIEYEESVADVH